MEEENENQEVPKSTNLVDNKTKEPTERDLIKDAELAAERLERANRKMDDLLNRQERLMAREMLGGKADAGQVQKKEETPQEYKERVMRGEL